MATQSSAFARHQVKALFLMLATEEWKPVPGFEGRYEVSCYGRVKSLAHYTTYAPSARAKSFTRLHPEAVLAPRVLRDGHNQIRLHLGQRRYKGWFVHRLVAEVFGADGSGPIVRHLNGRPLDNRLANLAFGTQGDNEADKVRHGTLATGERMPHAKLSPRVVAEIRSSDDPTSVLVDRHSVSRTTIQNVRAGKTWRHVDANA